MRYTTATGSRVHFRRLPVSGGRQLPARPVPAGSEPLGRTSVHLGRAVARRGEAARGAGATPRDARCRAVPGLVYDPPGARAPRRPRARPAAAGVIRSLETMRMAAYVMPRVRARLPTPLRRGALLSKYRIEKRLGNGRFANVYQAYDTIEGVRVALKVFLRPRSDFMENLFRHEARIAARLDHENIVQLKTAEIVDGHLVLVTELGERTLADVLERPRSVRYATHVLAQVLRGLAHAHRCGVIHRDVKP